LVGTTQDVPTESELRDFLKPFDMDGLGSFNIEEVGALPFMALVSGIECEEMAWMRASTESVWSAAARRS